MTNLNDWPIGAKVQTIVPLWGKVETGKDEYGLAVYGSDEVVPAGESGIVREHYGDGRILVTFDCDPLRGHTFGRPEMFMMREDSIPGLLAKIDRLRAANAELVTMLDTAAQFIDVAAWSGQTLEESEAMVLRIEQAIAKAKGEAE